MTEYAKMLIRRSEARRDLAEIKEGEDPWSFAEYAKRDGEIGNDAGNAALMEDINYRGTR